MSEDGLTRICDDYEREIRQQAERIRELEADAEKYRWMLKNFPRAVACIAYATGEPAINFSMDEADKAMDAAITFWVCPGCGTANNKPLLACTRCGGNRDQ